MIPQMGGSRGGVPSGPRKESSKVVLEGRSPSEPPRTVTLGAAQRNLVFGARPPRTSCHYRLRASGTQYYSTVPPQGATFWMIDSAGQQGAPRRLGRAVSPHGRPARRHPPGPGQPTDRVGRDGVGVAMKRFDVYLVTLDSTVGAEIQKTRPCLIISPDDMNDYIQMVIVAPVTTKAGHIRPASPRASRARTATSCWIRYEPSTSAVWSGTWAGSRPPLRPESSRCWPSSSPSDAARRQVALVTHKSHEGCRDHRVGGYPATGSLIVPRSVSGVSAPGRSGGREARSTRTLHTL